jgi:GH24 family phage-related lysozyme (muramidase)
VYDDADHAQPKKRLSSFSETRGHPTIGVGHLIQTSEYEKFRPYLTGRMSQQEIETLLHEDIDRLSAPLRKKIEVDITQSMWDALVLQAFNTGPYTKSLGRAVDAINRKDWSEAQKALLNGPTTSKGRQIPILVARRQEEAQLFLQDGPRGNRPLRLQRPLKPMVQQLRARRRARNRRSIIAAGVALGLVSLVALVETFKNK